MSLPKEEYLLTGNKFEIPEAINKCSGIKVGNDIIRSVLLSTDLSYIMNLDADAILVVNPFHRSGRLNQAIISNSDKPVFCDIGGGYLKEESMVKLAENALSSGAGGVLISKPTSVNDIRRIRGSINGTLIYTVMYQEDAIEELVDAGIDIFNVSTGESTAETVRLIRSQFPEIPVMANGGPYDSTIYETIDMGANAIVYNPPTATEMLRFIFDDYRNK